jgi:hypothetical protein
MMLTNFTGSQDLIVQVFPFSNDHYDPDVFISKVNFYYDNIYLEKCET